MVLKKEGRCSGNENVSGRASTSLPKCTELWVLTLRKNLIKHENTIRLWLELRPKLKIRCKLIKTVEFLSPGGGKTCFKALKLVTQYVGGTFSPGCVYIDSNVMILKVQCAKCGLNFDCCTGKIETDRPKINKHINKSAYICCTIKVITVVITIKLWNAKREQDMHPCMHTNALIRRAQTHTLYFQRTLRLLWCLKAMMVLLPAASIRGTFSLRLLLRQGEGQLRTFTDTCNLCLLPTNALEFFPTFSWPVSWV